MRDAVVIAFGGVGMRIVASYRVCAALRARFGAFVVESTPASVELRVVEREPFDPALTRPSSATLTVARGGRVALATEDGAGWFDLVHRTGVMEEVSNLGAIDALMRASLSLLLPLDGGLLLHGAVAARATGSIAFLGASGAGKSTVARAVGAACDELVIARPSAGGVRLWATPYWCGKPFDADARALVCLFRGGGSVTRLRGGAALRVLLPNVVRYASVPEVDRAVLDTVADVCARIPVVAASCPTGPAFLPYLLGELERLSDI